MSEEEIEEELFPKLQHLVRDVLELLPTAAHLDNSAAFMGWDIILDSNMDPWLMETNLRPDMRESISEISLLNPLVVNSMLEIFIKRALGEEVPDDFYSWLKV